LNLLLDFEEAPIGSGTLALETPSAVSALAARFQESMQQDGSLIRAVRHEPARAARFSGFPSELNTAIHAALAARGVEKLYIHQAAAVEYALAGRNTVVVTPTASGKTLCYNLPVVNAILRDQSTRAIFLFPTKALAEDQRLELQHLNEALGGPLSCHTYDGDTPQNARRAIREKANIVLTNPDMLHAGILPHHTKWVKLFENLRYLVIDELHYYRGVYGSHLANVLRRLKRICQFYGSDPQFICCSATIANPKDLAEAIAGKPFELVAENGAPSGEKYFIFYNPPVVNRQLGIRRSYLHESRRIALEFIRQKQQTLAFANSRLATEVLVTYLKGACPHLPFSHEAIRGYRGGYLPKERRQIEQGLRDGKIVAVVATNALELGVDIGSLDSVVLAGYPGSIASTWQRAGRAGRRESASIAVLVASSAPLDQYMIEHPEYFFGRSPEEAHINADNFEIYAVPDVVDRQRIRVWSYLHPCHDRVGSAIQDHHRPVSWHTRVSPPGLSVHSHRASPASHVHLYFGSCGGVQYPDRVVIGINRIGLTSGGVESNRLAADQRSCRSDINLRRHVAADTHSKTNEKANDPMHPAPGNNTTGSAVIACKHCVLCVYAFCHSYCYRFSLPARPRRNRASGCWSWPTTAAFTSRLWMQPKSGSRPKRSVTDSPSTTSKTRRGSTRAFCNNTVCLFS
jgi:superfamily II DNA/RNA helicase